MAAFCGTCGAQLNDGDSFCRSCGTSASDNLSTEVTPGYPASTAVVPTPAYAPAAPTATRRSRPGWLIPAAATAAVLLIAVVAGAVVLTSDGSSPKPLAEQVRLVVTPITTDVVDLAGVERHAKDKADLVGVRSAATRLASDATSAGGELATIKTRHSDAATLALLRSAVSAAHDYGHAAAAAASAPTDGNLGAARSAADEARASFTAVSISLPEAAFPPASSFNVDAISNIAAAQHATTQKAAQTSASGQSYVRTIDQLLTNSSETRGNLGDLINGVTNGTVTSGEAKSQIAGILNQRQSLQNSVAAIDPPSGFREPGRLLRQSLAAAITDDYAIQGWIDAWDQNDRYTFDQFWNKHLAATRAATDAKQTFVTSYNLARRQKLHTGPLGIGDNY